MDAYLPSKRADHKALTGKYEAHLTCLVREGFPEAAQTRYCCSEYPVLPTPQRGDGEARIGTECTSPYLSSCPEAGPWVDCGARAQTALCGVSSCHHESRTLTWPCLETPIAKTDRKHCAKPACSPVSGEIFLANDAEPRTITGCLPLTACRAGGQVQRRGEWIV